MTLVYVFPGQGSQHKGMGDGLFDRYRDLVEQADRQLGYSIEDLCLRDGDNTLGQTQFTQPALYAVNALSYLDEVEKRGRLPDYVAGHSLGEFSALFAAGAYDFVTGLKLVQKRGELMSRAPHGAMAAIINLDLRQVEQLLAASPWRNIDIANINSRKQVIISGLYDEVHASQQMFVEAGARFFPLNVSAAFHSRCMREVEGEYAEFLSQFELAPLQLKVMSNYTARPYPERGYADLITRQITHSVRWLESVSWLLQQYDAEFEEIGPGTVLTRLIADIRKSPLEIPRDEPAVRAPEPQASTSGPEFVFMYGGQGSQYFNMGKELYEHDPDFRKAMRQCDEILQPLLDRSLLGELYGELSVPDEMDDILLSHPALFSIGYALTQTLVARGIRPGGVLGYSLGEYVAATVSGGIGLEDGLKLVVQQAGYLKDKCNGGGMLTVLTDIGHYQTNAELYGRVALAGVNYDRNFIVSGGLTELSQIQSELERQSILSLLLPVRYGFHSNLIDPIESDFREAIAIISKKPGAIPIYSSSRKTVVSETDDEYFWDIVRRPIGFRDLVLDALDIENTIFIDLSPTATFSAFFKHGYSEKIRHHFAINQFGRNVKTINNLLSELS